MLVYSASTAKAYRSSHKKTEVMTSNQKEQFYRAFKMWKTIK